MYRILICQTFLAEWSLLPVVTAKMSDALTAAIPEPAVSVRSKVRADLYAVFLSDTAIVESYFTDMFVIGRA